MADKGSDTQTPSTRLNRFTPSGNTTDTKMAMVARVSIMSSLSFGIHWALQALVFLVWEFNQFLLHQEHFLTPMNVNGQG